MKKISKNLARARRISRAQRAKEEFMENIRRSFRYAGEMEDSRESVHLPGADFASMQKLAGGW